MGNCVSQHDTIVLIHTAATIRLTHTSNVSDTECVARCVSSGTDILPRYEYRNVMMIRMGIITRIHLLLPFAEVIQSLVRIYCNVEPLLYENYNNEIFLNKNIYLGYK